MFRLLGFCITTSGQDEATKITEACFTVPLVALPQTFFIAVGRAVPRYFRFDDGGQQKEMRHGLFSLRLIVCSPSLPWKIEPFGHRLDLDVGVGVGQKPNQVLKLPRGSGAGRLRLTLDTGSIRRAEREREHAYGVIYSFFLSPIFVKVGTAEEGYKLLLAKD